MNYGHILVAFDGSDQAKKALNTAVKMIQDHQASQATVLHVYNLNPYVFGEALITVPIRIQNDWLELAELVTSEAKAQLADFDTIKVESVQGNPAAKILEFAENSDVDLIIIGSRGLSGIREFVLGSVSHNVVQHAEVPVLVIK